MKLSTHSEISLALVYAVRQIERSIIYLCWDRIVGCRIYQKWVLSSASFVTTGDVCTRWIGLVRSQPRALRPKDRGLHLYALH